SSRIPLLRCAHGRRLVALPSRAIGSALGTFRYPLTASSTEKTASTTASATRGTQNAAGASNAWHRKRRSPGGRTGALRFLPPPLAGGGQVGGYYLFR